MHDIEVGLRAGQEYELSKFAKKCWHNSPHEFMDSQGRFISQDQADPVKAIGK
jgi:hypothetical protein